MHPNATIAFQLQETRSLLDAVLSIQPRVTGSGFSSGSSSGGGGGNSTDSVVAALCESIEAQLPPDLDVAEASAGLFERSNEDGKLNSLAVVLAQEVERFR